MKFLDVEIGQKISINPVNSVKLATSFASQVICDVVTIEWLFSLVFFWFLKADAANMNRSAMNDANSMMLSIFTPGFRKDSDDWK